MALSDRIIRRMIPAVPALSRVRPLMWPLDVLDRTLNLPYREFRALPPNRLRIRVGVGNRILFNAPLFRQLPIAFWVDAFESGLVHLDSTILDLGCGCGRFALVLRDQSFHGRAFSGRYTGVDVDDEMLDWCRRHFEPARFGFLKVEAFSKTYNPRGVPLNGAAHADALATPAPGLVGALSLPLPAGGHDFVFANSLFSHLLEDDFLAYLRESVRVLRPGGWMQFSAFCLEHVDRGKGSRWSFMHRRAGAHIEDERYPEAAVAYELAWLHQACRAAGFERVDVLPSPVQTMLRCRTPVL